MRLWDVLELKEKKDWPQSTPNGASSYYGIMNGGPRVHDHLSRISISIQLWLLLPPPSFRFRDIAAFVLQHATFSHPTSILPKISHVPRGVGGCPLGYEERSCWAIVRAISFQNFQPMWSWSTNVTETQTDGRTTCNVNTALTALCGKNVHEVPQMCRHILSD